MHACRSFLAIKCIVSQHTRVIFCLLEIQCTRFKFIHVLNFPLSVSMGMFYNDFGTMETKDKIEPHHMMVSAQDLYEFYSRRI